MQAFRKGLAEGLGEESLRLTVSPRAIKELGLVYRRPLDALRELIQNAIDAGASRIDIGYDPSSKTLTFEHNGKPIEGEYLDAFLVVGTDFKARDRDRYIGMFGIGRLSWLMLGHTAEIITANHKLIWREDEIERIAKKELDTYYPGVKWIIHLRDDVSVNRYLIESYVRDSYHGPVPVYVNGMKVELVKEKAEEIFSDGNNRVYLMKNRDYSGIIVKGVFTADYEYRLRGLLVETRDPRVRINPARDIIYDDKYMEWVTYIARNAVKAIIDRYSPEVIAKGMPNLQRLVETAFPIVYSIDESERSRVYAERIKHMVFETADGTYIVGGALDPRSWVFSELEITDSSKSKLERMRLRVFYVKNREIAEWATMAGFRRARDVIVEDEARRVMGGEVEEKLRSVFKDIKKAFEEAVKGESLRIGSKPCSIRIGGVEFTANIVQKGDVVEIEFTGRSERHEAAKPRQNLITMRIVGEIRDADIVLVESTDKNVAAFTDGKTVYVNVANPEVSKLILKTKRLRNRSKITLLWAPIIVHELLHGEGLDHTDPDWHRIYEKAMREIIEREVENL